MRFSVCIPTTRPTTVADAIRSVLDQWVADWELVVVGQGDEGELRRTVEDAAAGDERVRYHHISRRGLSIARNAGIAATSGEVVALLDDDCEAAPDWLAVLGECFDDPAIGLVGGSLLAPPTTRRFATCPHLTVPELTYDPGGSDGAAPAGWGVIGGNLAIRRSVLERVGSFDEQLGAGTAFGGAEETDYMLRVELAGTVMRTSPRSIVHHTHGHRYGLRAIYRHKRNYARGNGALAAKLTMLGDGRGEEWWRHNRAEIGRLLRTRRVHRLPVSLLRLWHFRRAYVACSASLVVVPPDDPVTAVLEPAR